MDCQPPSREPNILVEEWLWRYYAAGGRNVTRALGCAAMLDGMGDQVRIVRNDVAVVVAHQENLEVSQLPGDDVIHLVAKVPIYVTSDKLSCPATWRAQDERRRREDLGRLLGLEDMYLALVCREVELQRQGLASRAVILSGSPATHVVLLGERRQVRPAASKPGKAVVFIVLVWVARRGFVCKMLPTIEDTVRLEPVVHIIVFEVVVVIVVVVVEIHLISSAMAFVDEGLNIVQDVGAKLEQ